MERLFKRTNTLKYFNLDKIWDFVQDPEDIGKDEGLFADCIEYSPYMRHRLTLLRLKNMII
jgi:hypothetical protein